MTEAETAFLSQVAIGIFHVKEDGTIWRNARYVAGSRYGTPPTLRQLKAPRRAETSESDGYPKVMFTHQGKRMAIFAHRIVWMAVNMADIPAGFQINHCNGNRKDNRPSNLERVTPQENTLHAGRVLGTLGKKEQRGEKNTSAKLTPVQVIEIRLIWKQRTMTQAEIATRFGVSQQTITNICTRKTWAHLPQE